MATPTSQQLAELVGYMIDLARELCDPYAWDVSVMDARPTVNLRLSYRLNGRAYGAQMYAVPMDLRAGDHIRHQVTRTVRAIRKEIEHDQVRQLGPAQHWPHKVKP